MTEREREQGPQKWNTFAAPDPNEIRRLVAESRTVSEDPFDLRAARFDLREYLVRHAIALADALDVAQRNTCACGHEAVEHSVD